MPMYTLAWDTGSLLLRKLFIRYLASFVCSKLYNCLMCFSLYINCFCDAFDCWILKLCIMFISLLGAKRSLFLHSVAIFILLVMQIYSGRRSYCTLCKCYSRIGSISKWLSVIWLIILIAMVATLLPASSYWSWYSPNSPAKLDSY